MDAARQSRLWSEELVKRLHESNRYDSFVEEFTQALSQSQKVACLYKLKEFDGLFQVQENFKPKDKRQAEIFRAEGNKYFKVKNYEKALHFYTFSILKAPNDSENLSLAYNNRSLTNFYLKQYVLCIQDIELAFLHTYPKKSCFKLYQRLGRCLYHLRHKEEAIKAFQQTIVTLDCAEFNDETKQEMVEDMNRAIAQCSTVTGRPVSLSIKDFNHCHDPMPRLNPDSVNEEVPCLAECVDIRLDSYGGRGLYAKRDINIGEVLLVERPFSSVLLRDNNTSHCHHCCNRLFLAIPCRQCSGVAFCSLECQTVAWKKFHWAECRILGNVQDSKGDLGLLAMRMVLTAGYDTAVNTRMEEEVERSKGFSSDGCYYSDSYSACYSLVHHQSERQVKDLLMRTISALYYLQHLELVGFFSPSKRNYVQNQMKPLTGSHCTSASTPATNPQETLDDDALSDELMLSHKCTVGGNILRSIMMLPCNAHEVSELDLNVENPAMSSTRELAAAIYPVLSLINHSCDPSVVRHSFGNMCVARAIRSLKAGDELRDNYGALYPTMDLATRQDNMKSQYFFTCACDACLHDWPMYFDIPCENPVLRCSHCDGEVFVPGDNNSECGVRCGHCDTDQDISGSLLEMGRLEPTYKATLMAVINGDNSEENVSNLLTYVRLVEGKLHRPWRDINDCQEALKQCLSMRANCFPRSST